MKSARGMTLIDVLVGVALIVIVFMGLIGLLRASILVSTVSKARAGATAVADSQMEFIRSLSYDAVGTVGGIPAGAIPQSSTSTLNGVTYTVRTFVAYVDDPADGVGGSDANGITTDYKIVKVAVSYVVKDSTREVDLVSDYAPTGIETTTGGGTLKIVVVGATGSAVPGASVRVVNSAVTPAVDVTTFSDANGIVYLGGAATSTQYQVTVSKTGYSTAKTYARDATNQNPTPGFLTVVKDQTTTGTFAIDRLASLSLHTFYPITGSSTASTTVPNVSFTLSGAKTIGTTGAGEPIYKTSIDTGTDSTGSLTLSPEWDTYNLSLSGYDVVDACGAPPYTIYPGATYDEALYLATSTSNSLLVSVADSAGVPVGGASVTLSRSGFTDTETTSTCGAAYFGSLTSGSAYSITIAKTGYTSTDYSSVPVSGHTFYATSFP